MGLNMRLKLKNISHMCDMNRPRPRHGHKHSKHKVCLSNTKAKFEAQFKKKLSNNEAELKKSVAYKKSVYTFGITIYKAPVRI